jgi:hypothetical protein
MPHLKYVGSPLRGELPHIPLLQNHIQWAHHYVGLHIHVSLLYKASNNINVPQNISFFEICTWSSLYKNIISSNNWGLFPRVGTICHSHLRQLQHVLFRCIKFYWVVPNKSMVKIIGANRLATTVFIVTTNFQTKSVSKNRFLQHSVLCSKFLP